MRIPLRILQNQENFSTEEFKQCITPLIHVLNYKKIPKWLYKYRNNGFVSGIFLYICADGFDFVVTVSHRPAMVYGFLNRILPTKNVIHIAKEFFFEHEAINGPLIKQIFGALYRFSLKNVHAVVLNASGEIRPYARALNLPESRFRFIPWPSNINNPHRIKMHDMSLLAVGRSLRDWKTFFRAVDGLEIRCVVVASRDDLKGLTVPQNVELYLDINHEEYLRFLERAMVVVIPLRETQRSTGQASFLEAMAYGKPVIVADVIGSRDYVVDGENGLTYHPGDDGELREKIKDISTDEVLREKISIGGLVSVSTRYNKASYAKEVLSLIEDVYLSVGLKD